MLTYDWTKNGVQVTRACVLPKASHWKCGVFLSEKQKKRPVQETEVLCTGGGEFLGALRGH